MQTLENIKFWHKIKLNDGSYTNGISDIENIHKIYYCFDEIDFKNKTVLDIGCWDGFFSFEAEKRGAKSVVSLDDPDLRWGGIEGYNFLHKHFNSKSIFIKGNIYSLDTIFKNDKFDIVLCFGVLYHLSDPLLAMKKVLDLCKETASFEGLMINEERKILELLTVKELFNDSSNYHRMSKGYSDYVCDINGFTPQKYRWFSDRGSFYCTRTHQPSEFYSEVGFVRN